MGPGSLERWTGNVDIDQSVPETLQRKNKARRAAQPERKVVRASKGIRSVHGGRKRTKAITSAGSRTEWQTGFIKQSEGELLS